MRYCVRCDTYIGNSVRCPKCFRSEGDDVTEEKIEGAADRYVRQHTINILYTNHRGETARRRIQPLGLRFGVSARHPDPQWLLEAIDLDKNAERSFALSGLRGDVSAAALPRKSLLDQIHDAMRRAEQDGQPELAEWMRKHADEPCPAAIAQFMEIPRMEIPRSLNSTHGWIPPFEPPAAVPDAPASEPSRTDAIEDRFGGILPYLRAVVADHERRVYPNCLILEVATMERVVAALADAERKREITEELYASSVKAREISDNRLRDLQSKFGLWSDDDIEAHMQFVIEAPLRIADAEKRAKDAERDNNEKQSAVGELRAHGLAESRRADALTRKLAAAHQYIREVCPLIGQHADDAVLTAYAERGWAILAAIDAPAGEEAKQSSVRPSLDYWARVLDSAVAELHLLSGDNPPRGRSVMPLTVTLTAIAMHIRNGSVMPTPFYSNAETMAKESTPEPPPTILPATHIAMPDSSFPVNGTGGANARGSEAAPDHICLGAPCPYCPVKPFTAEEAQKQAVTNFYSWNYPRTVATLRRYADLLERDDALEMAVETVMPILTGTLVATQSEFDTIDYLNRVLAQRARKVE